jgi:hypothetical protein
VKNFFNSRTGRFLAGGLALLLGLVDLLGHHPHNHTFFTIVGVFVMVCGVLMILQGFGIIPTPRSRR